MKHGGTRLRAAWLAVFAFLLSPQLLPAQTSVTLNGKTYALKPHPRVLLDGASGPLTLALRDRSKSGRANSANPVYRDLVRSTDEFVARGYQYPNSLYASPNLGDPLQICANAAVRWYADGDRESLKLAVYCVEHVEDLTGGTTGCDLAAEYCSGRTADVDYTSMLVVPVAQMFSLVRSQLSPAQIHEFSAKLLNDNDQAHNGIDDAPCHNQGDLAGTAGSISTGAGSAIVTGSGTSFATDGSLTGNRIYVRMDGRTKALGTIAEAESPTRIRLSSNAAFSVSGVDYEIWTSGAGSIYTSSPGTMLMGRNTRFLAQLRPGAVIWDDGNEIRLRVVSVKSDTEAVLARPASVRETAYNYSPAWSGRDCGIVWLVKHHNGAPPMMPGEEGHYNADYFNGNSFVYPAGNLTYTRLTGYIAVALALADDDPRALRLLKQAYEYYYAHQYAYSLSSWTGFTQSGAYYTTARTAWLAATIAIAMRNSLENGPDLTQGVYLSRILPYWYFVALPWQPSTAAAWGDVYAPHLTLGHGGLSFWEASWLYPKSAEAMFANDFVRNRRGDFNDNGLAENHGSYLSFEYILIDPAQATREISAAPSQYLFRRTDFSTCVAAGLECPPRHGFEYAISKSGWDKQASMLLIQAGYFARGLDHLGVGDWGSYHILRNMPLLAGDGTGKGNHNGNLAQDNLIELGGGDHWAREAADTPIVRWAGDDPTGDAGSRFAYAMIDLTSAYAPEMNVRHVYRHIVHFKKAGTPDYVVSYDDIALSSGHMIKAYFHYWVCSGSHIVSNGPMFFDSSLTTNASLSSYFLSPSADEPLVFKPEGNDYPGNSHSCLARGNTYRTYVCASKDGTSCDEGAKTGEWFAVHKPSTDASDKLPPVSAPAMADLHWRGVEINDGTSPKAFVVSREGALYRQASFRTSYDGTGQLLIAGLEPGTYEVVQNGRRVCGAIRVTEGDNTAYCETASGNMEVQRVP